MKNQLGGAGDNVVQQSGIELDIEAFGVIDIYNMADLTGLTLDIHQQQIQVGLFLIPEKRFCRLSLFSLRNLSIESDQYVFEQMKFLEFESLTYGPTFFESPKFNLEFETNCVTVQMHARGVKFELLD